MKRSRFGIGAGFMLALAGLMGGAHATQPYVNTSSATSAGKDLKATEAKQQRNAYRKVHSAGGLDLLQKGEFGMSPKEYGLRFGHGNGKGKSNRLRLTHNAKLKRR